MSYYINLLTLFDFAPGDKEKSEGILSAGNAAFELVENTFFVGTPNRVVFKTIVDGLSAQGLKFTFLHVDIKVGAQFKSNAMDAATIDRINELFFK